MGISTGEAWGYFRAVFIAQLKPRLRIDALCVISIIAQKDFNSLTRTFFVRFCVIKKKLPFVDIAITEIG